MRAAAFAAAPPLTCAVSRASATSSTRALHRRSHHGPYRRVCVRGTLGAASFAAPAGDGAAALARRIAASFVAACAPTGVPYATAVREFVLLALDAYARGISLAALRLELRSGPSAPRPLASDEAELRDVWLSLVYKTLRAVRFPGPEQTRGAPDHFDAFVSSVVAARRDGSDLRRIQLEHAMQSAPERTSPLESAILRQSTRLVVVTMDAANERRERGGVGDKSGDGGV